MNSFLNKVHAILTGQGDAGTTVSGLTADIVKKVLPEDLDWEKVEAESLARMFNAAAAVGRGLYQAEVAFEDVLLGLAREVAERLQTRVLDPCKRQRLQRQTLGALITVGGTLLGYHDEALRWRRYLMEVDLLTQVASRERFLKELDTCLEYVRRTHEPLSLVWVDVDDLRLINDLYGYSVGDAVLRGVASLMAAHFGSQAVVVGGWTATRLAPCSSVWNRRRWWGWWTASGPRCASTALSWTTGR